MILPNEAIINFISFRVRVTGGVYPTLVYAVTTICFDSGLMGVVYPDAFIIRLCSHVVSYPHILSSRLRMTSVVTDFVCRSATFSLVFTYGTTINFPRYVLVPVSRNMVDIIMYWFPVDMKCALVSLFAAWLSP